MVKLYFTKNLIIQIIGVRWKEDVIYHSETCEKMVAYRALYGDNKLWCRPYEMFLDEVNKNGQKYRFELQDIKSIKD